MMRFTKFLKIEADIIVARNALVASESVPEPVIFVHPNLAKTAGIKEGDIIEVARKGRSVKLKVKVSENCPENGCVIPNGLFASYLADLENFKRFKASIEVSEGEPTKPEEILESDV